MVTCRDEQTGQKLVADVPKKALSAFNQASAYRPPEVHEISYAFGCRAVHGQPGSVHRATFPRAEALASASGLSFCPRDPIEPHG
jgi:hypothetical protein